MRYEAQVHAFRPMDHLGEKARSTSGTDSVAEKTIARSPGRGTESPRAMMTCPPRTNTPKTASRELGVFEWHTRDVAFGRHHQLQNLSR